MQCTMKDIALRLGISVTTVSHALNGTRYVSPETKAKVMETAHELGYTPNYLARGLKNKPSKTIGIIIPNISSSFFPELVRALEDMAYKSGYNTILCNTDENIRKEYLYFDFLRSKRVDGIILASSGGNSTYISHLIEDHIPLVFVDRYLSAIKEDYVGFDNKKAAMNAVEHLLNLGHRKIAFVTSKNMVSSAKERLDGYKTALLKNDIPYDKNLIFYTDVNRNFENIQSQLLSYLEQGPKPDCLLATNGVATLASLATFSSLGLKCPDDIGLMGFCDYSWTWLFQPYLSMVDLPVYDMGTYAMKLLIHKIEHPDETAKKQSIRFPTQLVIRDSCGAHQGPSHNAYLHL